MKRLRLFVLLPMIALLLAPIALTRAQDKNLEHSAKVIRKRAAGIFRDLRARIEAGEVMPQQMPLGEGRVRAVQVSCSGVDLSCLGYVGSQNVYSEVAGCVAHDEIWWDDCNGIMMVMISWPGCVCGDNCFILDEVVCY